MRLVIASAFRGDDRLEVDSGASGGKLTQHFRAVGDHAKRKAPFQATEHLCHLGPGREFGISLDQPIGAIRRQTYRLCRFADEDLVGTVSTLRVSALQIRSAPTPPVL